MEYLIVVKGNRLRTDVSYCSVEFTFENER